MSAVHMLECGLVDINLSGDGGVKLGDGKDLIRAAWRGDLPVKPDWPKDDHTAAAYLAKFGLSTRDGEELGQHRLAVDPDCVEDFFDTLEQRIDVLGIKSFANILLMDELREHKDFEKVKASLKVVADSRKSAHSSLLWKK